MTVARGLMRFHKSIIGTFLVMALTVFAAGCTTELIQEGSVTITCSGWSVAGWGFDSLGSETAYASATDGSGQVILPYQPIGSISSGTSFGHSASGSWAVTPADPNITLILSIDGSSRTYSANCRGADTRTFTDGRLNQDANQTAAVYCTKEHGVKVLAIYKDAGYSALSVTAQQIADALATAVSTGKHVKIASGVGHELWALSSNELQVHNAMGEDYNFRFAANTCNG
jgi:hypothetical protein